MKNKIFMRFLLVCLILFFCVCGVKAEIPPESDQATTVSCFVFTEHHHFKEAQHIPVIALFSDNTFSMKVNMYVGMSFIYGTYEVEDNIYHFNILRKGFGGFIGDDVYSFTMRRIGNELEYIGGQIGTTREEDIFAYSDNVHINKIEFDEIYYSMFNIYSPVYAPNPKTGDGVFMFLGLAFISAVGILIKKNLKTFKY